MPPTNARPDAVKFPSVYNGGVPRNRQAGVVATAESLLGVDKAAGELARCYDQGGYIFAVRDRGQSLVFPQDHELRGRSRYSWDVRPDGVEIGTLVAEARPARESKP